MTNNPQVQAQIDAMRSRLEQSWQSPNTYLVQGYPADCEEILNAVCRLWNLRAPNSKKSKAYWIQSARELLDACGEHGVKCLEQVSADFEKYIRENRGLAPFTVEGPGSLIKMARAKAAQMRSRPKEISALEHRAIHARKQAEEERRQG